MLAAVGQRENGAQRQEQRSREGDRESPRSDRGTQRATEVRGPLTAGSRPRRADQERAADGDRDQGDRGLAGQQLQAHRQTGGNGRAGARSSVRGTPEVDERRAAPGQPGRGRARVHERRAVREHHPREPVRNARDEGAPRSEPETARESPRAEERPQDVKEVVRVEGRHGREHASQQEGRIEQHRVGVGEKRLSSGGRGVDERNAAGHELSDRLPVPGPVRDLSVAKDEQTGAENLGQEREPEENGDRNGRDQVARAPGHCDESTVSAIMRVAA